MNVRIKDCCSHRSHAVVIHTFINQQQSGRPDRLGRIEMDWMDWISRLDFFSTPPPLPPHAVSQAETITILLKLPLQIEL
jgi:hypothetical protein